MTSTLVSERPTGLRTRPAWPVILLCWLIVVFDGYDLIVYGTTIPSLLKEPGWGLSAATAGFIGSLAFGGMLVGALAAGTLADRLGRRRTILWCTLWFSLFTALCYVAPNREIFGLLRFFAGLGLGGLVPSANALTAEFVSAKTRSAVSTIMMSGVPIGGTAAALIGTAVIPAWGWRPMYAVAFAAVLILVPVCVVFLPESPTWLRAHGRPEVAARIDATYGIDHTADEQAHGHREDHPTGIGAILRAPWLLATVMYSIATVPPSSRGTASAPGCPSSWAATLDSTWATRSTS